MRSRDLATAVSPPGES